MTSCNTPAKKNDHYTVYDGAINTRMQDLLRDGGVPLSYAQVMQQRVAVLDERISTDERNAWWNTYLDTGDGARRHPDGGLKIAYDSRKLRSLTPRRELHNGALLLTSNEYAAGDGPAFTAAHVAQYTGKQHRSFYEVLANPIWQALAREDKALLREYARAIFATYDRAMAIWAPNIQDAPVERLWLASSFTRNQGAAKGNYSLVSDGRLVGVAPESSARENRVR